MTIRLYMRKSMIHISNSLKREQGIEPCSLLYLKEIPIISLFIKNIRLLAQPDDSLQADIFLLSCGCIAGLKIQQGQGICMIII